MAKDGTKRGGARAGAGRPKKQKPPMPETVIVAMPDTGEKNGIPEPDEIVQKSGALTAYLNIFKWLKKCGAENAAPKELVEILAVSWVRWKQAEEKIEKYGYLSKHPTTGAPIKSPIVQISDTYASKFNQAWYALNSVISNCEAEQEVDPMEKLLLEAQA